MTKINDNKYFHIGARVRFCYLFAIRYTSVLLGSSLEKALFCKYDSQLFQLTVGTIPICIF